MKQGFCLLLVAFFLSGCWDTIDLEHAIYITGLGIDYKDDQMHVYIRTLPLEQIGKSEGGATQQNETPVWIGHGVGDTFDSASDNLYLTTQQRITWSHISNIIFTTEALEQEGLVSDVIEVLNRYAETRSATWMYGTRSDLTEFFSGTPILNLSPYYAKENDPLKVYKQYSFIEPRSLRHYLIEKNEPGKEPTFPILDLNVDQWTKDTTPTQILEWAGAAVMGETKAKGIFTLDEIKGLRWLQQSTERTAVFLYENDSPMASFVSDNPDVTISPLIENGVPRFIIDVNLTGTVNENLQDVSVPEIKKKAEEVIKEEIYMTYKIGADKGVDFYDLGYSLFRKNPSAYKKLDLDNQEWLEEDTIKELNVSVEIQTGGKLKLPEIRMKQE